MSIEGELKLSVNIVLSKCCLLKSAKASKLYGDTCMLIELDKQSVLVMYNCQDQTQSKNDSIVNSLYL